MKSCSGRIVVRVLALLFCLGGMGISYAMTREHLKIPTTAKRSLLDVCDKFEGADCEEVMESPWGTLSLKRLGIESDFTLPTSLLGLFYFTGMFVWLLLIGAPSPSRWPLHLLVACVAALSLGFCVFLFIQMKTLAHWCPLCVCTHCLSLLIFLSLLLLWPRTRSTVVSTPSASEPSAPALAEVSVGGLTTAPHPHPVSATVIATLLAIILAFGFEYIIFLNLKNRTEARQRKAIAMLYERELSRYQKSWQHAFVDWFAMPRVFIDTADHPARGPVDARHTIVVYGDFQCPSCARMEKYLRETVTTMAANRGGVRIIFKHFPIHDDCNPYAKSKLHPGACQAGLAAEAARLIGGDAAFLAMHDALFERRTELAKADRQWYLDLAKSQGLNAEAFAQAMDSPEAHERIQADLEEGEKIGSNLPAGQYEWIKVSSTPAVFVNNRRLRNPQSAKTWQTIFRIPPLPPLTSQAATESAPASASGNEMMQMLMAMVSTSAQPPKTQPAGPSPVLMGGPNRTRRQPTTQPVPLLMRSPLTSQPR